MHRRLVEILACPVDKHHPLGLIELETRDEVIVEGVLTCGVCGRYYPITDGTPNLLPDKMRKMREDLAFLEKWSSRIPEKILHGGKPWSL